MLHGLGFEVSAYGVAQYYEGLLQGLVIDTLDAALQPRLERLGLRVWVTNTIMRTLADRQVLAQTMLTLARKCQS
jgi:LPPG:FO 2-phospho-L-lactate transferase